VCQDHHAPDGYLVATAIEEARQRVGGLVELHARRTAAPVFDRVLLNQVPVPVVFVGQPGVAVHGDRGVEVLDLDGEKAVRAEEQVVYLAAGVAVAMEERPAVVEGTAQGRRGAALALDACPEDLFLVGDGGLDGCRAAALVA
jgi:hypothetical protein